MARKKSENSSDGLTVRRKKNDLRMKMDEIVTEDDVMRSRNGSPLRVGSDADTSLSNPQTRKEEFLARMAGLVATVPTGEYDRIERYLMYIIEHGGGGGGGNDANLAPVEVTSTASQAYAVNSFLVYNGQLYCVTAAIAQGDTLTVGTNIAAADVGTYLAMVAAAPNAGGFAPAGYGSAGETLTQIGIGASTEAAFNTQLSTFFQTLPNSSFSAVRIYPDWLSDGSAYLGIIFKVTASYGSLVVMPNYNLGNDIHGVKRLINNVWSPYEWVNPPLIAGTEYRTTERFNGKPVYVKAVSVTSIPTAGNYTVTAHGITNLDTALSCTGTISGEVGTAPFTFASPYITPTESFSLSLYSNAQGIIFYSASSQTANVTLTGATAILKYTKTTD